MGRSGILVGALSAAMGLLPVVPPEHVHEGEEHGHAHLVVHRHLQPHGSLEHHAEHPMSLTDDDGPIITLTATYTVPNSVVVAGPPRVISAVVQPPAPRPVGRAPGHVDVPIHGPPRAPTPLRAPPLFPAS